MKRLDYLIFGYRTVRVTDGLSECADIFLKADMPVSFRADGSFDIKESEVNGISEMLDGKVSYTISDCRGLLGFFKNNRKRYGFFAGIIISALLMVMTSLVVWDVRIIWDGDEGAADVTERLSDVGLKCGAIWFFLDTEKVENTLLMSSDDIAWVNINRRGGVAYVELAKRAHVDKPPERFPCNIVAGCDAVIDEIDIISGAAVVKPGETVTAGDLLISGTVAGIGGTVITSANGRVRGRVEEVLTVSVSRFYTEKVFSGERTALVQAELFGFPINIFKRGGNSGACCDIIYSVKDFSLFGEHKLPFSLRYGYEISYTETERTRSDVMMIAEARERMSKLCVSALSGADIVSMTSSGYFDGDSYVMTTRVVSVREIGQIVGIETDAYAG